MSENRLGIADHGLIGDLRSCALVGTDGTIDWFCAPRFDSPSVFGAILDGDRGGSWRLAPTRGVTRSHQFYFPDTAVLITRFLTPNGVAEVHDFMPVMAKADDHYRQRLVRRVSGVRGKIDLQMRLDARPDYARQSCSAKPLGDGVLITGEGVRMGLTASTALTVDDDNPDNAVVCADIQLTRGDTALFVLEMLDGDDEPSADAVDVTDALLDATTSFWRDWLSQSRYVGRWREMVHRSAITLKLLTHEPTGAIIAAPTTSIPERIGGERNWDYRYVWMRDAGFSMYALLRLGFIDEARSFTRWLSERLGHERDGDQGLGPLRVLYNIDGNLPDKEVELDHLSGHRDSTPVRVGNAAVNQLQLDIYGELIDSVYLFNKYGPGISDDAWRDVVEVVDWVMDNWDRDDAGMWELRGEKRAFTTSRLMCWVALERTIRIARQRGLPGDIVAWSKTRDEIYDRIMTRCYSAARESFTQTEDGDELDAGVLLMPMVKFLSPADPKFLSTLRAIERELITDSLVFRYDPTSDGLDGEEGTFSICSFWYVEALTRAGRLDDAQLALEKMFTYANHVGLYAEQVSATGEQVGNFPQAFTHLALISAAINLDRALN
ncbi:Glucoamylase (glucan-1,4-alpha-glucosidase), GH15 family [Mycobacterium numidiamassiliense]|uniref:Glucoamylase (Glucan-1,4-alpha-glucosidase), GH15 family n=1 Tax=Mycobacterium numidiamassiliense TaxID=1841861 RepID=A0A2U3P6T5_9MYCO|nr:glycoside hydrolase family 15 protein [Mycobacterium numidiamassiliense]SPM39466.1 Glucoamylase (glucan-1,4-alpha-glucosidase), GH15 family [Mycobacterium numidiamassiliense]